LLEFSHFSHILLNLFDVSNAFHDSLLANIEKKNVKRCKHLKCYHEMRLKH